MADASMDQRAYVAEWKAFRDRMLRTSPNASVLERLDCRDAFADATKHFALRSADLTTTNRMIVQMCVKAIGDHLQTLA